MRSKLSRREFFRQSTAVAAIAATGETAGSGANHLPGSQRAPRVAPIATNGEMAFPLTPALAADVTPIVSNNWMRLKTQEVREAVQPRKDPGIITILPKKGKPVLRPLHLTLRCGFVYCTVID